MSIPQWDHRRDDLLPTLLLVDDDADDYYLLQQAIKIHPLALTLIHRSKAIDLLEWLDSFDRLPDLILMDFHMPQISGLELLTLLKQQPSTRSIPVVMWSSFLDQSQQEQCYRADASWVVLKPDNQPQLSEVIAHLVEHWFPLSH